MTKTDHQLAAFAAHEVLRRGEALPTEAARRGARVFRVDETRLVALVTGATKEEAMQRLRVIFSACLLALVAACSTPEPTTRPANPWFARAVEIVETSRDADEIRGRMAVEWAKIMNPIGDHAGMTDVEKRAAVSALADGWTEGLRRKGMRQ